MKDQTENTANITHTQTLTVYKHTNLCVRLYIVYNYLHHMCVMYTNIQLKLTTYIHVYMYNKTDHKSTRNAIHTYICTHTHTHTHNI